MTTDNGIDLVAHSPKACRAFTIQVKTNRRPKLAGGTGRLALDWWLRVDSPAELVALVDLASDRIWLFRHTEFASIAQQQSNGSMHLYFYVEESYRPRSNNTHFTDFLRFELQKRIDEIFGVMLV